MPHALTTLIQRVRGKKSSEDDDNTLVQAVIKGDRLAFEQLVIRYSDMAYGLAYRMVQQPELAEDLVQDCFIKVWQQAERWNPDQGKFSTWLYRVVSNRCLDELRSAAHRYHEALPENDELEAAPAHTDAAFDKQQQQQQFQQALSQLKLEQRTAIALVYHSGLSNKEAAKVMDLQLKAFESLLGRTKSRLKQQIATLNPTGEQ